MEKEITSETSIDDEIKKYLQMNSKTIYKQTSNDIGSRVNEGGKEKKFSIDGKFTKVI